MYQVWRPFLGEVITGKDRIFSLLLSRKALRCLMSMALGCPDTEHILTSVPLNQSWMHRGTFTWSKHSHVELCTHQVSLEHVLKHSCPCHCHTSPRWAGLTKKAMITLILETGLALHGTVVPWKPNKSMAMNSCVSIKDYPHTKSTCHQKITESWSFITVKA